MDETTLINNIINEWKLLNVPTCNCSQYKDVRGRCQPEDDTFKICKVRVYTAMWYIENCGKTLEDFEFLGAKLQYLIKRLMEEEEKENN
jgi:uncharacterized cysteine cluster protein YcgN (CxxCxxCC family)